MFWTTAQIAEATGLSQRHVGHLLRNGKIAGYKIGHDWIVQEEEALRFIKEYKSNPDSEQQDDHA